MDLQLRGRRALITGGSRGIGLAVARALLAEGVAVAVGALGGIDILINNAAQPGGQAPPPKLAGITDDAFFADVNVKVLGYLRCAREGGPFMMEQGGGGT